MRDSSEDSRTATSSAWVYIERPYAHGEVTRQSGCRVTRLTRRSRASVSVRPLRELLQLPNLHAIPSEDRNQQAISFRVISEIGGTWHSGGVLRALGAVEPRDRRIGPARHDDLSPDHLDAIEPTGASGDYGGRAVARLPREDCLSTVLHDDEPPPHGVEGDAIGPAEGVTPHCDGDFAVRSDPENSIRPGVQDVSHVVEADAGVGDVDSSVRRDRNVIQENGAQAVEPHAVDRSTGARIECAQAVDVRHPQRVAEQSQTFGRVEGHTSPTTLDELEHLD